MTVVIMEGLPAGPRECLFSGTSDAPSAVDYAIGLVRTAQVALRNKDDLDDQALEAVQLTLATALERLDGISAWVLDTYNDVVSAQWEEAIRRGIVRSRTAADGSAEANAPVPVEGSKQRRKV